MELLKAAIVAKQSRTIKSPSRVLIRDMESMFSIKFSECVLLSSQICNSLWRMDKPTVDRLVNRRQSGFEFPKKILVLSELVQYKRGLFLIVSIRFQYKSRKQESTQSTIFCPPFIFWTKPNMASDMNPEIPFKPVLFASTPREL